MTSIKLINIFCLILLFSTSACKKEETNSDVKETFVMSDKMLSTTKTATAQEEFLKNQLNFFGKITSDNNKFVEIYPVVGGNVIKVNVELGDYVNKGQVLAIIRSTEVASFEKELDDAKNDVTVAQNKYKVAKELFDGKLVTEKDVVEAKGELEKAKSQLNRISQTYKIYNIKPGAIYEVLSPLSGFVIQKNINEGMLLRSDNTDNIFDVAEITDVWAIANVNESDISQVKIGNDAEITTLSYQDKKFYGKVDKIYNIIDPETKAMKARVKLDNKDFLLKPEMRASIKISYTENKKMIAIPSDAIVFDKSKSFVMIFKDKNNIETRAIEIFRQVGNTTYVAAGLQEGEKVLTTNQLLIYDALND
ncbi:efflux RND transporter periplasmic adaptor subunit [Flavobacterium sp. HNIBRBA15423]|uniref:efflux RND transporter periplasmic adaptor subunit n=1 Tax=Flavobacterium sp. HNIBRBA15423 TaxID=3458683 RepID=UPI0040448C40